MLMETIGRTELSRLIVPHCLVPQALCHHDVLFFCCCGFLTATCVLPAENMPASLLGSRYRFCCHPAHLHAPAPVLAHLYLGVM